MAALDARKPIFTIPVALGRWFPPVYEALQEEALISRRSMSNSTEKMHDVHHLRLSSHHKLLAHRLGSVRSLEFNLGNLFSIIIVVALTIFFEYLHYQESKKFEPEHLLIASTLISLLLILFQFINYIVIARDNSLIVNLMKRLDVANDTVVELKQESLDTRNFYKRADDLIGEFAIKRDDFEYKVLQTLYKLPYMDRENCESELKDMRFDTDAILAHLCATTCAVISLRKHQNEIMVSANIKSLFVSDDRENPYYAVIARSASEGALRGRIDRVNKKDRFLRENYFFAELFDPYNSREVIFNNVDDIIMKLGPDFREPNGKTKELYSHCIMTKIIGNPILNEDVIRDKLLQFVPITRADDRCYFPDIRENVLGILTVDSQQLTFDQEYDTSILREMAVYASSIMKMYDMVSWIVKNHT